MIITSSTDLGERIRRRRVECGLSQTELAERINATRQWVSRLEQGRDGAGVQRLLAVFDALDLVWEVRAPSRAVAGQGEDRPSLIPSATFDALRARAERMSSPLSSPQSSPQRAEVARRARGFAEDEAERLAEAIRKMPPAVLGGLRVASGEGPGDAPAEKDPG